VRPAEAKKLFQRAAALQREMESAGLGPPSTPAVELYDRMVTNAELREATRQLYMDGHYAKAVEEGFKYINKLVRRRTRLTGDGTGLMRTAFSANQPYLKLNEQRTQSQKDEQQGYMDIFAGCMMGIRNPRAHEQGFVDGQQRALELLTLANHLVGVILAARARRR
jgi:uncharacterized protein (TIGR02391 family)